MPIPKYLAKGLLGNVFSQLWSKYAIPVAAVMYMKGTISAKLTGPFKQIIIADIRANPNKR
jgi:hypothetical protein